MRFGSVCSGIEAASVAWNPLGWQAAWFAEIEPFPCAVLAHHYPDVPNYGDMTKLPERILSGEIEAPDMLCGGTPCQAFSVAGQRKSLDDDRGNLSLVFCKVADAIDHIRLIRGDRASIVFWENVPGVLNTKDNAFGCFLGEIVGSNIPLSSGANGNKWPSAGLVAGPKRKAAWRVLDAQHHGVPQRRRRVFVVASARDDIDPGEVLFECTGLSGDSESCGEERQGTPDEFENSIGSTSEGLENNLFPKRTWGEYRQGLPCGTIKACGDDTGLGGENLVIENGFREGSFGTFVKDKTAGTVKAVGSVLGGGSETLVLKKPVNPPHVFKLRSGCEGGGKGYLGQDDKSFTLATNNDQYLMTKEPIPLDLRNATRTVDGGQGVGIGKQGDPSPTLTTFIEPGVFDMQARVRKLTPRECERLQGFPDDYTKIPYRNKSAEDCPDSPRYKAIGNSWAVPCVRWIGERIQKQIDKHNIL